jgi:DNA-binding HxlR family transcriptional regulator
MSRPTTTAESEPQASPSRAENGRRTYNHPCLIAQTLDILGDRWTLLILRDLMSGLHRFNDIIENCGGMSPNVLSERLRHLEAAGLITRHHYRELPPRVEYHLTEKGWAVRPILLALIEWGRQYLEPFGPGDVGERVPADFAFRVIPTFSFHPERAVGVQATMVIEVTDCDDCNTWSLVIQEGRIYPRRRADAEPDVRLVTTTEGFFRFIRGEAPPEACGEIHGPIETAATIQSCFLSS